MTLKEQNIARTEPKLAKVVLMVSAQASDRKDLNSLTPAEAEVPHLTVKESRVRSDDRLHYAEVDAAYFHATATAACSVSAEPPLLLICVNAEASAHGLIERTGRFCLNVLARNQDDVAKRFAGIDGSDRFERFDLGGWSQLTTGAPALDGALANFDCVIEKQVTAGTHSIFIGRIVDARIVQGLPLIYGDGRFTGLAES